jgi:hypothetical protein
MMSDDTRLYISVESSAGHLVVDGPMALWRELVGSLAPAPPDPLPLAGGEPAANRELTAADR